MRWMIASLVLLVCFASYTPAAPPKGKRPSPHRCTCGCEETGICACPNCSVGCGFIDPKPKAKVNPQKEDGSEDSQASPTLDELAARVDRLERAVDAITKKLGKKERDTVVVRRVRSNPPRERVILLPRYSSGGGCSGGGCSGGRCR